MNDNIIIPEVLKDKNLTINIQNVYKQKLRVYLTKEQINESLSKISNHKDKFFCMFLWMTGVRVTEAINVKKRDINLTEPFMVVRWQKNRKYEERVVPIHPQIKTMLQLYTGGLNMDDKVFPFSRIRAYYITKKWLGVSPHKIRHTFAINFRREGGTIEDLRTILGHKHLNTTGIYSSLTPYDTAKQLEKIKF
jgi:integrase/recombinase XerD